MDFSQVLLDLASKYGLMGFFAASVIANATIFLPLPIELLVFAAAGLKLYNPLLLGLFAGAGAAVGELTGYFLGRAGNIALAKLDSKDSKKIFEFKKKVEEKGMAIIFVFAAMPLAFDIAGIASGLIKFDFRKFFIALFCGKVLRYIVVAYAGFYGIEIIRNLIF